MGAWDSQYVPQPQDGAELQRRVVVPFEVLAAKGQWVAAPSAEPPTLLNPETTLLLEVEGSPG